MFCNVIFSYFCECDVLISTWKNFIAWLNVQGFNLEYPSWYSYSNHTLMTVVSFTSLAWYLIFMLSLWTSRHKLPDTWYYWCHSLVTGQIRNTDYHSYAPNIIYCLAIPYNILRSNNFFPQVLRSGLYKYINLYPHFQAELDMLPPVYKMSLSNNRWQSSS